MKRDEKNLISRQKILNSALLEFANRGYGLSSVNTICTAGDISKGILYHYFKDKDELYLVCVKELFDELTAHLKNALSEIEGGSQAQLEMYFDARLEFFQGHPLHHKLFCSTAIAPPQSLISAITEIKFDFDTFNISILTTLLGRIKLRSDVTMDMAVETFRIYQDFVNARFQMGLDYRFSLEEYENTCRRSLSILLYGVAARGGADNE